MVSPAPGLQIGAGAHSSPSLFPGLGQYLVAILAAASHRFADRLSLQRLCAFEDGFPAENVANGSVLVVKTHEFGPNARKLFDRVVLLVRNPFASLQAEFNRRSGGHTGHASADK